MKASRITVSRSKRGTTIKASGSAAQALFEAVTSTPKPPEKGTVYTTVTFEDHGQDFVEWDIEEASGRVFDVRPCQSWLWIGRIVDLADAAPGRKLNFTDSTRCIKYPIKSITTGRIL